jgi:radical SAM-linked protein
VGKVRLKYIKTGRAKYISHLDLTATMQRAIIRCGAALKYSEGFNPHPFLSVALRLSVGIESLCELMDVGLLEPEVASDLPQRITDCLPEGLLVTEAYTPERKFADITWLELRGLFTYDNGFEDDMDEKLISRLSSDTIEISKKTKRGQSIINIPSSIRDYKATILDEKTIELSLKVTAQNPTLGPNNVLAAFDGAFSSLMPDFSGFTRVEVYDGDLKIFR